MSFLRKNKTEETSEKIKLVNKSGNYKYYSKLVHYVQINNITLTAQIELGASVCSIRTFGLSGVWSPGVVRES